MRSIAIVLAMTTVRLATAGEAPDTSEESPALMTYARPEVGEGDPAPDAAEYQIPDWKAGDRLFAVKDDVAVLAEADPSARLIAKLAMGTPVVVREIDEGLDVRDGRVDRWYRVSVDAGDAKEGWVFGAQLTSLAFTADLDADGEDETITVALDESFRILVRVLEPATRAVSTVDLRPSGEGYLSRKGGNASASLVAAATAGIPLLKVDSSPEACADYSTSYLSYSSPGARASGTLRVALPLSGVIDPPVSSTFDVKFDPRARTATVTHKDVEEEENGKTTRSKVVTRYALRDGVYVERR